MFYEVLMEKRASNAAEIDFLNRQENIDKLNARLEELARGRGKTLKTLSGDEFNADLANARAQVLKGYNKPERTTKSDAAKMLAAGYAGSKFLNHGAERVLGVQRFVHGTSDKAADSILAEGMLASHGGGAHGSSAKLGDGGAGFVERSKGRVHIFKDTPYHRRLAAAHANLAEVGGADAYGKGFLGLSRKGTRVYGAMPYDRITRDFELDPDYGNRAFRSRLDPGAVGDIDASHLSRSRAGLRSIIKNRTSNLKGYIMNNKARFGRGLAHLGVAAGAAAYAGSKARKIYRDYKDNQ
ncbi:MAG: hypothetical protein ACO32I_08335 [Candidatus Limnocylindrus sp.]